MAINWQIREQLMQATFEKAVVIPSHADELASIAKTITANKSKFDAVSAATGIPWFGVACISSLESGLDFSTYLQNGDPLFDKNGNGIPTVHVPAGVGPFPDWEAAAIAALGRGHSITSLGMLLCFMESYNGNGYLQRGVMSPYIWSFTNQYSIGKYTDDGVYNPDAISTEAGCAAILKTFGISSV
jgi:lysozyme family protein